MANVKTCDLCGTVLLPNYGLNNHLIDGKVVTKITSNSCFTRTTITVTGLSQLIGGGGEDAGTSKPDICVDCLCEILKNESIRGVQKDY